MTPERWRQIKKLYEAGRERSRTEREAFLEEACQGDEELRREVESLLAQQEQAHSFLESPALDVAAVDLASENSPSLIGKHLVGKQIGSYRVLSLLGKGGMGEVYLAQDVKKLWPKGEKRCPLFPLETR